MQLQKLPKQWTNAQPHLQQSSAPRNWTQVAAMLGYDTKATNISFRIKEWLRFHHIDAFFDYLMGIPNPFYTDVPADDTRSEQGNSQYIENGHYREHSGENRELTTLDTRSLDSMRDRYHSAVDLNIKTYHQEQARFGSNSPVNGSPRSTHSYLNNSEQSIVDSPLIYDSVLDCDGFRKRSFDKIKTLARKRSTSLLSSMNTLSVDEKELDDLSTEQLKEMVSKLNLEVIHLRGQCHRFEDQVVARDQRIHLLQKELDDKNHLLNRAGQFKELIVRYMDLL
jgi:hypothetical protein